MAIGSVLLGLALGGAEPEVLAGEVLRSAEREAGAVAPLVGSAETSLGRAIPASKPSPPVGPVGARGPAGGVEPAPPHAAKNVARTASTTCR